MPYHDDKQQVARNAVRRYNGDMHAIAKHRTLHVWIAMLALLFSVLAPAVSHALSSPAASRENLLVEVCSAVGDKTLILSAADTKKSTTPTAHAMEHCAYCTTHGASVGLPPPSTLPFAVVGGHDFHPAQLYTAPAPRPSWTAACPRAPPFLA